jgi:ArsR family transcriptional regulator, arsenate/arsenite/antimonite-responsive transcriptional repressor
MEKMARAAQALSDETRLRIVNLLTAKECCVCEVMQALDISQTRASRNLKILNDAGFLKMRTDGLFTLYALADGKQSFQSDLVSAVRKELANDKQAKQDIARLSKAERVGAGCGPKKANGKPCCTPGKETA